MATKQYGTCAPICSALPTEEELKESELLAKYINEKAPASTTQEDQLKESVLGRLSFMVQDWVKEVVLQKVSCSENFFKTLDRNCRSMFLNKYFFTRVWENNSRARLGDRFTPLAPIDWVYQR